MTVADLIEKLSQLPLSTLVIADGELDYREDPAVYRFQANVHRNEYGHVHVTDDNGRDDVETVVLITPYGHDDKEEL
ncbi:hypothetical protein BO226_17560 [Rhodococcus sp. 2G]|uniref:hypothetical protein n=1 Tax=Rhodococcus sp. 2G TaxID=1570939 RepID=UPI000903A538|nr:hypothetical protein [Rhodococcus sp. 2G]APE10780.1 hypothetical protein BO226_17560 [Rhodococcus sp. 2G]